MSPAETVTVPSGRDANGEFGIDQIEAFGAKPSHQQRGAGKFYFGFRRGRDDGAVTVPHHDIADADGDADSPGALDLRAADLDGIAVTDIFLDRGRQPGRGHIEIDRTGAEPPPQPAEAAGEDHHQNRDHDGEAFDPAFAGDPTAQAAETIAEPVKAGVRPRQQPARAIARRLVMVDPNRHHPTARAGRQHADWTPWDSWGDVFLAIASRCWRWL